MPKHLLIYYTNIRSINKNIASLELNVHVHNYDIILVSESWINNNSVIPNIDGYSCAYSPSARLKSGGVVAYVKDTINFSSYSPDENSPDFEILIIKCVPYKINLVLVYRHPQSLLDSFLKTISNVLSDKSMQNDYQTIVIGDINVDLLDPNAKSREYLTTFNNFNYQQIVTFPTRVTENTASLIDHVFISADLVKTVVAEPDDNHITDHSPIVVKVSKQRQSNMFNNIITTRKPFTAEKIELFR